MNSYIEKVLKDTQEKNNEPEFNQAVAEVLKTIEPFVEKNPNFETQALLERIVEPERIISFRVPWIDDNGKVQVNKG